jgi:hypothetical protein
MDTKQPPSDRLAVVRIEWQILQLLLIAADDERHWPLWPIEAVVAETSDPVVALDALADLCDVGLLQRHGDSVMVTRGALRFHHLVSHRPRADWARPTGT